MFNAFVRLTHAYDFSGTNRMSNIATALTDLSNVCH